MRFDCIPLLRPTLRIITPLSARGNYRVTVADVGVEGVGVRVRVGVRVGVGVRVDVAVLLGVIVREGVGVREGVAVGMAVGASPSRRN